MTYVAMRFDVEAADGDAWSDALLDAGALSVDAVDPRAGTPDEAAVFAEPSDAAPAWWAITRLTALCEAGADPAGIVHAAAGAIERPAPPFEALLVRDEDWVRKSRAQFSPLRIADGFWIVPSWCDAPCPDAVNLVLDPGLAFGTGTHPTTRLCLQWLHANIERRASVLDYGCGSGILAIAAAKLGSTDVTATDIDAQAITACVGNAKANVVDLCIVHIDALPPRRFTHVVANILANPLRLLAPALAQRMEPGGRIALSGILASQAAGVIDAYAEWCNLSIWRRDGDWVLLSGVRRDRDG